MDERKREDVLSDKLDKAWSDADYEEVSGTRHGHLHRIIIGGVLAIVVVLILVFMFSDRQPPEVPKEKDAVQLKIPLEDEPAPAMADNVPVLEPCDAAGRRDRSSLPAQRRAGGGRARRPAVRHGRQGRCAGQADPGGGCA